MPTAKVFAAMAELVGAREITFEATTVREFLDAAGERYGKPFQDLLLRCTVLLNGEQVRAVGLDLPLQEGDELAILPPVAGGREPQDWQCGHQ